MGLKSSKSMRLRMLNVALFVREREKERKEEEKVEEENNEGHLFFFLNVSFW